ncbi:MAG: glycosyltransferase family 39 protein [Clostridia bacterium]|nr:glycosyltransferase family 39 protein [Clostridia bacterium]
MENKIVDEKKEKNEKWAFIGVVFLACLVMFFFMSKKEGWHCDEIFSYGSSNCYYENTLHPYGEKDSTRIFLETYVFTGGIKENINNLKYYYIDHSNEREEILDQFMSQESPVWRTREDAEDYVKAGDNRFNYISVYYNQLRDVHPPLFYMLVHTVSSIFNNVFSKYIIFFVLLPFFIATCYFIRKILILLDRKEISLIAVLLYSFSMGAISTMMFQRMYMMLSFFTIVCLFLHLKIRKNNYETDSKTRWALFGVTVLGFLTQYYYCIYAALIAIVMSFILIKKKSYKELFKYIRTLFFSAIVGLLVFPFAIEHIFFSYRGVNSFGNSGYFDRLYEFIKYIFNAFGGTNVIIMSLFAIVIVTHLITRKKDKDLICLIGIPVLLYIFIIAKIAPYMEMRYIMNMLPILSIIIVIGISGLFDNKMYNTLIASVAVVFLIGCGFVFGKPLFLYKGYQEYIDISEKYSDDSLVYVGYTIFNHIESVPEFMNYKQTLMLSTEQLDLTKNDKVLDNSDEFILIVNRHLGNEHVLKTVMENTGYSHYEILKDDSDEGMDNFVYRVYR